MAKTVHLHLYSKTCAKDSASTEALKRELRVLETRMNAYTSSAPLREKAATRERIREIQRQLQKATSDFDFAKAPFWILKRDTEFPAKLGWQRPNLANGNFYVPDGTVFYEVSLGKFVPHFAKNGTPFAVSKTFFVEQKRG